MHMKQQSDKSRGKGRNMKTVFSGILVVLMLAAFVCAQVGGGDVVMEVKGAANVKFSHDKHVGMGKQCTECHDSLYVTKAKHKKVTMAAMGKGQSCGSCHDGKQAFNVKNNCGSCHRK
jgi:c(7)-type cytochrome triheme protein